MKDSTIDNICIAAELGNDLARFSVDELQELALQQVAPEVATNALCELEGRDETSARAAALEILARPSWDVWLESYALDALCRLDVDESVRVMDRLLNPATNTYFLEAMVVNVESEILFFSEGTAHVFASRLALEVRRRDISSFQYPDEVKTFLERFPPGG
jgi:hypothetical protein